MNYYEYSNQIISKYIYIFITTIILVALLIIMVSFLLNVFIHIIREKNELCILKKKEFYFSLSAIILTMLFLLLTMTNFIDCIKDISFLKDGNFISIVGIVVSQDAAGGKETPEDRTFKLQNIESGEIVELKVFYTPIKRDRKSVV